MIITEGEFEEEITKYTKWAIGAEAQARNLRDKAETYIDQARKAESAAEKYRKIAAALQGATKNV